MIELCSERDRDTQEEQEQEDEQQQQESLFKKEEEEEEDEEEANGTVAVGWRVPLDLSGRYRLLLQPSA